MTEIELLVELLNDVVRDLKPEILPLDAAELAWQPGAQANSIGITLWHIARGMDFLATRVVLGKPVEDELWHTNGWCDKTGYDPRGLGYGGWGVLTGYTWEDVLAIPPLTAGELMQYMEEACSALTMQVRYFTPEALQQPAQAMLGGKLTYYRWVKEFYKGFQAHIGEIMAIKAAMERAGEAAG